MAALNCRWLGALLIVTALAGHASAQTAAPGQTIREDLAAASRILAAENVLDAYGHVSVRDPSDPSRYLMPRSLAPALTTAADILTFDLDSNPIDAKGATTFLERFIHGEIYKRRPDVMAIVHSHSPAVVPFGIVKMPLLAVFRNAAFLAAGAPVFDIAEKFGETDMLVRNREIGAALAETLGAASVALLRGHGDVVVAPTLPLVVFRAVYTELDARIQTQAVTLGGPIRALTPAEGVKSEEVNALIVGRAWELWKRNAGAK